MFSAARLALIGRASGVRTGSVCLASDSFPSDRDVEFPDRNSQAGTDCETSLPLHHLYRYHRTHTRLAQDVNRGGGAEPRQDGV